MANGLHTRDGPNLFSGMPSPMKPSQRDLEDAIEHADSYGTAGWHLSDFDLKFLGNLTPDDLGQYDDIQAWADLDPSDFEGLDDRED